MHRLGRNRRCAGEILLGLCLLAGLCEPVHGADAAPLRRVLVLGSFGRSFAPYNSLGAAFKSELARQVSGPLEFHEASIEVARFSESQEEEPLADYLRALFAERRLDLVVPMGGAAVRFWKRQKGDLFPSIPTLIAGVEERHVQDVDLTTNASAVCVRLDLPGTIEDILRLLPGTTQIAVVLGASPLESFWFEEARREWLPFADRVQFIWWNALSFEEMRRQAAVLPRGSAIFYMMMTVDVRGIPYEAESALALLHAAANAPIFGLFTTQLGRGIVGGRLVDPEALGRTTAQVARRILDGERPGSLKLPPVGPGAPVYDWRELRRWHIPAASLPPRSTILHRVPSSWERHRWKILLVLGVVLSQAMALAGLLVQRAHRRRAELESQERRRELLHATRVSTLGEFAASLAHELHQPLSAILRNAEAAELLLQKQVPDRDELRAILADIREDDGRAAAVIDHLRTLLKSRDLEARSLSVADLFTEVQALLRSDAAARGVKLSVEVPPALPRVVGDPVHLVQVLLNLMVNALEASSGMPDGKASVSLRARHEDGIVEIAISDTGRGISDGASKRLFNPFHTTKANGLGLGLSISRTIIEAHGGRIWAGNNPQGGATFRFTLPVEFEGTAASRLEKQEAPR